MAEKNDFSSSRVEPQWEEPQGEQAQGEQQQTGPVPEEPLQGENTDQQAAGQSEQPPEAPSPEATEDEPESSEKSSGKSSGKGWLKIGITALVLLIGGLLLLAPLAIGLVLQLRMQEWVVSTQTARSSIRILHWKKDLQWLESSGELQVQLVNDCQINPDQPDWIVRYRITHRPTSQGWGQVDWSVQPANVSAAATPAWQAHGVAVLGFDRQLHSHFNMDARQLAWLDAALIMSPVSGDVDWDGQQVRLRLRSDLWRWDTQPVTNNAVSAATGLGWQAKGLALDVLMGLHDADGVTRLNAQVKPSINQVSVGQQRLQNVQFALDAKELYWPSLRQMFAAAEFGCQAVGSQTNAANQVVNKRQQAALQQLLGAGFELGLSQLQASGSGPVDGAVRGQLSLALAPSLNGADMVSRLNVNAALRLSGAMLSSEQFQSALASGFAVPLGNKPADGLELQLQYANGQLAAGEHTLDASLLNAALHQFEAQLQAWLRGQVAPVDEPLMDNRPPPQPLPESSSEPSPEPVSGRAASPTT